MVSIIYIGTNTLVFAKSREACLLTEKTRLFAGFNGFFSCMPMICCP